MIYIRLLLRLRCILGYARFSAGPCYLWRITDCRYETLKNLNLKITYAKLPIANSIYRYPHPRPCTLYMAIFIRFLLPNLRKKPLIFLSIFSARLKYICLPTTKIIKINHINLCLKIYTATRCQQGLIKARCKHSCTFLTNFVRDKRLSLITYL